MTNINWAVRLKSKKFWLAMVPAILLLAQTIATPFGYNWDFAKIGTELTSIINAAFALLTILGVVVDPTTAGVSDSPQAMIYGKTGDDVEGAALAEAADAAKDAGESGKTADTVEATNDGEAQPDDTKSN